MLKVREMTLWQRGGYKVGGELLGFVVVFAVVRPSDELLVLITIGAVADECYVCK